MNKTEENDEDMVIISVEGTEFQCNRSKLSNFSPYFNAMFNGNFTEKNQKNITIKDVKVNSIVNILKLLDEKSFYIPTEDIFDTLQGASMLQFDQIKQQCIQNLQDNITIDNCLRIWFLSDKLNISPLSEKAKCKSLMDFNIIKNLDSILSLNIKELHSYLGSTLLHCDNELDVFETGIKWWYDFCKKDNDEKDQNCDKTGKISNETKYLLIILRCLDYTSMTTSDIDNIFLICPDIYNNTYIKNVLINIKCLINKEQVSDETAEERKAVELYINCRKRTLTYLPCIVCYEFNEKLNEPKRFKYMNCNCVKTVNIYYFDEKLKSMEKIVDLCMHNEDRCNALLEGFQMMPYKEHLLFFGGEYQYGTADWNRSVWAYNTFKDNWKLLTKLPKERRHFKTIIIEDKLYIIGGTGKYRIIQDNMMVYDIKEDAWDSIIKLPDTLFSIKCCEYKKGLFVISGKFSNRFGFLFNTITKVWQRIDIVDSTENVPKDMGNFVIFTVNDYLYIRGTHLIQMELYEAKLIVKKCINIPSTIIAPDEMGCCQNGNDLYLFCIHTSERDLHNIYLLERWNLETNKTRLLLQINDNVDVTWNIHSGCFPFFHYNVVKDSKCVLDFVF